MGDIGSHDNDGLVHDWRADSGRNGDVLAATLGVDLEQQVEHGGRVAQGLDARLAAQHLGHDAQLGVADALHLGVVAGVFA